MSKLDILNSYLTERLAVAVREILEAVEATVTEYQQETAKTRVENESLKQQLRDILRAAETTSQVQDACKPVSEEISPRRREEWNSVLGLRAELQQKIQQKFQQSQNKEDEEVLSEERLHTLITIPHCKKELSSEVAALKVDSPTKSLPSLGTQKHISQQGISTQGVSQHGIPPRDISQRGISQQGADVAMPVVRLHRVKTEPEDTDIPITAQGTEIQANSGHIYSPKTAQSTLSPSRGPHAVLSSDVTDLKGLHNTSLPNAEIGGKNIRGEVQGETVYKCPQCTKSFRELKKLQIHQESHERAFGCSWCGKGFHQSADLRRHLRTHTGERPFRCTWCSKSFSQRSNLCRHMRIHTGEKPYQCPLCASRFSDGHTLKKHQRKHYEERYCCSLCDQRFTIARSLQLHLVKQHMIEKANVFM